MIAKKTARLRAKLFAKIEEDLNKPIDVIKEHLQQQTQLQASLADFETEIQQLCEEKVKTTQYIMVKDMPPGTKFNKLKTESKLFMNTIRMITYRAETTVANLLAPNYKKSEDEKRMLVKEIIASYADMIPDEEKKIPVVRLHSLSTPRANEAAKDSTEKLSCRRMSCEGQLHDRSL